MPKKSVLVCGLPNSGKTTFLAALWHLVAGRSHLTTLQFDSLIDGDFTHLNAIAQLWRNGKVQIRTELSKALSVTMNLRDSESRPVRLHIPDLSGESFREIWEDRECSPSIAAMARDSAGVLLMVHSDTITLPMLAAEVADQARSLGAASAAPSSVSWSPSLAPTQVKLVDLLQLFRKSPIDCESKRLAVMFSAWDKIGAEGRSPAQVLSESLPLLSQYLKCGDDEWEWQVYGVSAQGGDYEQEGKDLTKEQRERLTQLRALDEAADRILVVDGDKQSNDLTAPIAWLMG